MKTIIYTILSVLTIAVIAFAANVAPTATQKSQPVGVEVVTLHTSTAASADTFATTEIQTYGPYEITASSGEPMFGSFSVQGDAITGTTPVIEFSYQLVSGLVITDTVSQWTPVCTLGTSGTYSSVDLSALAGKAIVFRCNNYDGTESQIPGVLRVYFKDAFTYNKNR